MATPWATRRQCTPFRSSTRKATCRRDEALIGPVVARLAEELAQKGALKTGPEQRGGGGAIVNMSSTAALRPVGGLASYMSNKQGVLGLTKVAAAVLWLCSDEASFVTGTVLPIDGGKLAGTPPFKVGA